VFHLAGLAHVKESWSNRKETIETNFLGSLNLLEACRELPTFPKVLLVGSAECYGRVGEENQPILETHPLAPASPYAVSKIAQEMLAVQYGRSEKLPVYVTRSFNHTGPRQKESFVCSGFARQVALAEAGQISPQIVVGNLSAKRDFSDVRDVVRAYKAIVEDGQPGEPYNVCSGEAHSIREVLDTLLSFSSVNFEVTVDSARFRPSDLPLLVGSPEKLKSHTGWVRQFSFTQTLQDLLNYWRFRVRSQSAV
jgi:GDP-4-dehydro-6-deoxy-D-mannose reductase